MVKAKGRTSDGRTMTDVFKFEGTLFERRRELCLMAWSETALVGRAATLSDIKAALAERGLCVVAKVGAEPTDEELSRLFNDASGDLETLVENPIAACSNARRALFRAGQHSRDEEIARLTGRVAELEQEATELEGMLHNKALDSARIASELTDQLEAAEKRVEELKAALAAEQQRRQEVERESERHAALLRDRAESADRRVDWLRDRLRAELAAEKEKLAEVERERDALGAERDRIDARRVEAEQSAKVRAQRLSQLESDLKLAQSLHSNLAYQLSEVRQEAEALSARVDILRRERDRQMRKVAEAEGSACRNIQRIESELAACQKVVEAVGSWARWFDLRWVGTERTEDSREELLRASWKLLDEWNALAAAGKDSGGQSIGKDGAGDSPGPGAGRVTSCDTEQPAPSEPAKSLRAQAREKLDALSDSQVSNLWVSLERLEPEPPPNHPGIPESSNPSKSSNGSTNPPGIRESSWGPDKSDPLPWRSDVYGKIYDANDHYISTAPRTSAFIVARCNAPEPSAKAALSDWQHWAFDLVAEHSLPGEPVTDDSVLRDRISAAVKEPAAPVPSGSVGSLASELEWQEQLETKRAKADGGGNGAECSTCGYAPCMCDQQ